MNRILIVEDHNIVRQGVMRVLKELLDTPLEFEEAASGQEALDKVSAADFDLVLLDISLPGRNGLEVLKQLRQQQPKLPVLILSMHPEQQYAVRAIRAGAAGYVTKDSAPEELKAAVEKVLRGGRYLNASQADLLADALRERRSEEINLHETLSDREYQLARMMTSGMTMTEIARELSLSVKTISTYRTRILEKLRLRSNADIISYFITHELIV